MCSSQISYSATACHEPAARSRYGGITLQPASAAKVQPKGAPGAQIENLEPDDSLSAPLQPAAHAVGCGGSLCVCRDCSTPALRMMLQQSRSLSGARICRLQLVDIVCLKTVFGHTQCPDLVRPAAQVSPGAAWGVQGGPPAAWLLAAAPPPHTAPRTWSPSAASALVITWRCWHAGTQLLESLAASVSRQHCPCL